jgi:putative DNA primase/helicase
MSAKIIPWPNDPAGSPPDIPLGRPMDGSWLLQNPATPTTLTRSDFGNAERLILMYRDDLRFCHELNSWLIFERGTWSRDTTGRILRMMARTMCATLQQAVVFGDKDTEKFAWKSLEDHEIRAGLRQAENPFAVSLGELDQRPELLAFENGVVDLRSGELREGRQKDYITKRVRYEYRPDARCPVWLRTLHTLMGGGPDASESGLDRADRMVDALQAYLGYGLSGSTVAKVVFIFVGPSNCGKTTVLNTFRELLGDEHATLLNIDTLMRNGRQGAGNANAIGADLADLCGVRFAQTSEVEEGQRLSESRVKLICQGMGRIKARRLYANWFSFDETHKLFIDSNHKPLVRANDSGLWSRLIVVPFERVIPDAEMDRSLRDRLKLEAEGILAWAVAGAMRFYASGMELPRPPEVSGAVAEYRMEMDSAGRFIEDRCELASELRVGSGALYGAYRAWSTANGEHPMSQKAFSERLKARGLEIKHSKNGNVVVGVEVRATDEGESV